MAAVWLQIEFLYNVGLINPYADITAVRRNINRVNKSIEYDDRFFGKDGIYIP